MNSKKIPYLSDKKVSSFKSLEGILKNLGTVRKLVTED